MIWFTADTHKIKPAVKYIIIWEALDVITTYMGVYILGLWEANPLLRGLPFITILLIKIAVTIFVSVMLQKFNFGSKLEGVLIGIAMLPVFWNIAMLALGLLSLLRIL